MVGSIALFRADKRRFVAGESITTAGEFVDRNPDGLLLEDTLDSARPPGKPARIGSLFLFDDFRTAEWHWAKMAGGVLYECSIDLGAVAHRGDMRLVDQVGEALREGKDPSPHVQSYWAGANTPQPRWELLVAGATVTKVICDDQHLRQGVLLGRQLPEPI
jgi:hypothetical protein